MDVPLNDSQVRAFVEDGFVRIENAFSATVASQARDILWKDLGCDPMDKSTWTRPVIRLYNYGQEPFRQAGNTDVLHGAFDQLVGSGRWTPRGSLGTFPVRFPSKQDPGDAGWHAEASFQGEDGSWRLNVTSTGRALLMLFLFSDVDVDDAPTRILTGSHLDVPSLLKPHGNKGLSFIELARSLKPSTFLRPLALATGKAGTVYLCHPFLIHAAQTHHDGTTPRFMAQPPLHGSVDPFGEHNVLSPVEKAIRIGLGFKA
jgi:hypothetical protein